MKPIATDRSATGIPTGRLAMWLLLPSEIVIFGGLLACYLVYRFHNPEWAVEATHLNIYAGGFNAFVLLTSSLFILLAQHAAEKEQDYASAFKWMWATVLCGLTYLGVKAFEYTTEISHGFTITANVFWSFYFGATAIHGLHVVAGGLAIAILSFYVKDGKHVNRIELAGIYWHFVDLVWIFLFPLLYIAG
jgi:heme/copper-type cytochrome/quinol oxidase subunit 3